MKKIILTLLLTLSALVNVNAVAAFSLDVDGNGSFTASNDGLVIFKYLLNSNANNLHTTVSSNASETRETTPQLRAYLDNAGDILDVDGNGSFTASNDGLIIFKYLLNSNANNLHTTVSSNAPETRETTPQLKAYLDGYINAATALALNDTGVTVSGTNGGTAVACSTDSNIPVQDCHQGRDADTNLQKTGAGHAGFDFTKLGSDGAQLTIQNGAYSATGTAANGTKWSCVRDNVTGMIWEVKTADNKDSTYTWGNRTSLVTAANAENSGSGLCGITNWRVPSVNELFSIVNYNGADPSIDSDYFPNTANRSFWSEQGVVGNISNAWRVDFGNGQNNRSAKSASYIVRLVSAATAAVSYTNNNNGTITDNTTGLMWKACDQGQAWDNNNTAANLTDDNCTADSNATDTYNWTAALTEAQNHTFAGYDDWRLPNVKELTSIADYTKENPSINPAFPNANNTASFWPSTLYANTALSNAAWNVNFNAGFMFANSRAVDTNRVRLVRTAD